MLGLMLLCLIPFAVIGILIGHLVSSESIGPVIGGSVALFAFLGGIWFPITGGGVLHQIAEALPSFWLVQASHVAIGGTGVTTHGWIVIVAWTVAAGALARRAYRRDTKRAS
jgi:ABC-2 type transport system permease protein